MTVTLKTDMGVVVLADAKVCGARVVPVYDPTSGEQVGTKYTLQVLAMIEKDPPPPSVVEDKPE